MSSVEVARLHGEASRLRDAVRALLADAPDERCQQLGERLTQGVDEVLSIAFVGQYNAGKSSLIKALVPTADVVIDSNVATDSVVEVVWNGLRLIDTPGVHAGRTHHDEVTEKAVAASDLLIFVTTADLFDATIARYFRSVVIEQGRGAECLLVVNKSAQDAGTRETKLAHLADVLTPLTLDDVHVVFTDALAKSWADSAVEQEEREELLALSGFAGLTESIDSFARRSGLRSMLTTPVYEALGAVDDSVRLLSADVDLRDSLDLLEGQRYTLLRHRREVEEKVREAIVHATRTCADIGESIAASVTPDDETVDLQTRLDEGRSRVVRVSQQLDDQVQSAVWETAARLAEELQRHDAFERLPELPQRAEPLLGADELRSVFSSTGLGDADLSTAQLKEGLSKISSFFAENSRAGQKGHELVYRTGKRLGVKFKPWGAVKTARRLGHVAQGLGVAVSAWEMYREHHRRMEAVRADDALAEVRRSVRGQFATAGRHLAEETEQALASYLEESYNAALATIDDLAQRLMVQLAGAGELTHALLARRQELQDLLVRIHGVELEDVSPDVLSIEAGPAEAE